MLLFGNIVWQGDLNAHANFTTFPQALLLLFRVATGDNWAALLQNCMVRPPLCDLAAGNCGHSWAPLYFFSFYLAGAMIALNLLTTVILVRSCKRGVLPVAGGECKQRQRLWPWVAGGTRVCVCACQPLPPSPSVPCCRRRLRRFRTLLPGH